MQRTYNPSKEKRKSACGFHKRMNSKAGRRIIKRRRKSGRKRLTLA